MSPATAAACSLLVGISFAGSARATDEQAAQAIATRAPKSVIPQVMHAEIRKANRRAAGIIDTSTDTQPPALVRFRITHKVDAAAATGRLAFDYAVTDDQSGFAMGWVTVRSPSGQFAYTPFGTGFPALKTTGQEALQLNAFSEPGQWTVISVFLYDLAQNSVTYSTDDLQAFGDMTFQVVNRNGVDRTPPALVSGVIRTPTVSLSQPMPGVDFGPQQAVVSVRATDTGSSTISGVSSVWATFCQASGWPCFGLQSRESALIGAEDRTMQTGGGLAATGAPEGTYYLYALSLGDAAGNYTWLQSTAFGGSTDFSAPFHGKTVITVVP